MRHEIKRLFKTKKMNNRWGVLGAVQEIKRLCKKKKMNNKWGVLGTVLIFLPLLLFFLLRTDVNIITVHKGT